MALDYYAHTYNGLFYKDHERLLKLGWKTTSQMARLLYYRSSQGLLGLLKRHRDYFFKKGMIKIIKPHKRQYCYLWAPESERLVAFIKTKGGIFKMKFKEKTIEKKFEEQIIHLSYYTKAWYELEKEYSNFKIGNYQLKRYLIFKNLMKRFRFEGNEEGYLEVKKNVAKESWGILI